METIFVVQLKIKSKKTNISSWGENGETKSLKLKNCRLLKLLKRKLMNLEGELGILLKTFKKKKKDVIYLLTNSYRNLYRGLFACFNSPKFFR